MPAPTALPIPPLHPFVGQDLPWLLEERARLQCDRPYIIWDPFEGEGRVWSYAAFAEAVERVAAGMAGRDISAGDFVLIHLGNCPEFLIAWHACSRLGAIAVTTNTRSSADELAYYATNCGAVAAVTQPSLASQVAASSNAFRWIAVTETDQGSPVAGSRVEGTLGFTELDGDPASIPQQKRDPLALNSVQYTSGTTSRPKGVVWTHANILWGARNVATNLALTQDDVGYAFFPLFHTNSLMYASLGSLWAGASFVLVPRYSASRFWGRAIRHGCTWTCTSPFVFKTLESQPLPEGRHSFRLLGSGTSDPPAAQSIFGTRGLGWFGMTETVGHPIIGYLELPNRPLAMGRPAPGYEVAVVREDGSHVAFGETGMLMVRGTPGISLFYEYLNDPVATAAAFDGAGWMHTGDLATPYEDGCIRYEGRGKDMIRVGAENVAAAEVERVIAKVPGVFEVAVVGGPHELLGEVPVAFVIPAAGAQESGLAEAVLSACRQLLADFKVPRQVILVPEFPRATLNKVSKKDLRKQLAG